MGEVDGLATFILKFGSLSHLFKCDGLISFGFTCIQLKVYKIEKGIDPTAFVQKGYLDTSSLHVISGRGSYNSHK